MTLAQTIEVAQRAERNGAWEEALELYTQAIGAATEGHDAARLAELLRWIGRVHRLRGDLVLAEQAYRASLAVAEANGLMAHTASALNVLAMVEQLRGRVAAAETLYARARDLASEAGEERLSAMIETNLGTLANIRGETEVALATYGSALERYQRLNDDLACASALNNMGLAHVDRNEWDGAEQRFAQALEYANDVGDAAIQGTIHLNHADLHLKRGDLERAREQGADAFAIFSRLQSKTSIAETYKRFSSIYREAGRFVLARVHLDVIAELARQCADRLLEGEIEHERALLHVSEGRNREALVSLNNAHEIFTEFRARREVLDIDKRLDRIEETYLEVVRAWGDSIESKDLYTAGHCGRVADYACMLAEAVGFSGRDLTWMRMGGFLHDVGKTAIPSEVLNKPGKLTDEEFDLMKRHPVIGDEMLSDTPFPWDIRPIVRNHHERWDGSGYPDRLKGEEIPLTARILCVADVYDALTSARSYRKALTHEEAMEIMTKESGTVLDPKLFQIFSELIGQRQAEVVAA